MPGRALQAMTRARVDDRMTPTLHTAAYVHAGLYQDSVALMRVAQGLQALPGVVHATLADGQRREQGHPA
jgi:hypothetical protein